MKLSSKKMLSGEYHVFLGVVKIAEIHFINGSTQWKVELRYGDDDPYQGPRIYENMLKAIGDLWHLLECPIPEGAAVISMAKHKEEKEAADMRAALKIKPNMGNTKKKKKKSPPVSLPVSEEVQG